MNNWIGIGAIITVRTGHFGDTAVLSVGKYSAIHKRSYESHTWACKYTGSFFTIPLEPDNLNGKNLMRDNMIVTRTIRQVNCVVAEKSVPQSGRAAQMNRFPSRVLLR